LRKPASLNQRRFNPIELPGRLDRTPDDCAEIDDNYSPGADIRLFGRAYPFGYLLRKAVFAIL
jgi:hypothetical protein